MTRKAGSASSPSAKTRRSASVANTTGVEAALATLQFRASIHPEKAFSGDWRLEVTAGRATIDIVSEGSGWFSDGGDRRSPFAEGDLILNLSGAAHRFESQFADHLTAGYGDPAIFGGARLVSIEVEHLGPSPHPLIGELPPLSRVPSRGTGGETTLSRLVSCVISEARSPTPAIPLVQDRLASALVLEAVRSALSSIGEDRSVWLAALADPEIGPVLAAMLRAPETDWSVASLAESGAMSRSTFARRFQQLFGCGPMDVLVDIRMRKAGELLKRRGVDLKSIARSIGYRSTAAFSASFKRWCGQTPSDYRQPETGNSLRT